MYRIFVGGEYLGDYTKLPWLGGKDYYLYNPETNIWQIQTSTNWRWVKPEKVPKEYLAINLLLGSTV